MLEIEGRRPRRVLPFGSYSRGEAKPDSDIDLAAVLGDFASKAEERKRMSDLMWRLSWDYDALVGSIPIREREWRFPRSGS